MDFPRWLETPMSLPRQGLGAELLGGAARRLSAADFDLESVSSGSSSDLDDPTEVVIGPTYRATSGVPIDALSLAHTTQRGRQYFPIKSGPRCVSLGDVMRLSFARSRSAPLSFGSVLHLNFGGLQPCRPCMFEKQRSGRCRRSWLCDFCHMHQRESFVSPMNLDLGSFLGGRPTQKSSSVRRGKVWKRPFGQAPPHYSGELERVKMASEARPFMNACTNACSCSAAVGKTVERSRPTAQELQHGACFRL
mmetsp:Transcript_22121/g.48911  ORF Transcript_22121/g.48911 Transcript_22121/m.48911 type:complete len:250 (+) Transcript_22121:61-810(+)